MGSCWRQIADMPVLHIPKQISTRGNSEKQTCPQKKGGVYVVGFITTLYWRVNPKDEKLDLLHF